MITKSGCIALAMVSMAALGRNASALTLDSLDHGSGSIVAGNATYSNFTYGGTTMDSTVSVATSATAATSTITFGRTVTPWTLADGNSVISYHVDFAAPISALELDFLANASGAVASVGETLTDGLTHVTYMPDPPLQVVAGIGPPTLTASYVFPSPVSSLDIVKSIDIAGATGDATITSVTNTYSTSGSGIPEPSSLCLLAVGTLGFLRRRR